MRKTKMSNEFVSYLVEYLNEALLTEKSEIDEKMIREAEKVWYSSDSESDYCCGEDCTDDDCFNDKEFDESNDWDNEEYN